MCKYLFRLHRQSGKIMHKGLCSFFDPYVRAVALVLLTGSLIGAPLFGQDLLKLQGLVQGMERPEDAVAVRLVIAEQPLVGMVRVCPVTHTVMIQAKEGHGLSGPGLSELLAAKGFHVYCFRTLGAGEDFAPIDPAMCTPEPVNHIDQ
jgi:hypothetical protein